MSADNPTPELLARWRESGMCAATSAGARYVCTMPLGHPGAHVAIAEDDEGVETVVDTWAAE